MSAAGRGVWLHLRARSVPGVLAGLVVLAALSGLMARWLRDRPIGGGDITRLPVLLAAPLGAAVLVGQVLTSADPELELSMPRPRVGWHLMHALPSLLIPPLLLATSATTDAHRWGSFVLARNALGCVALMLIATCLGAGAFAAIPTAAYLAAVYAVGPPGAGVVLPPRRIALLWPVQPSAAGVSWVIVLALAAVALLAGRAPQRRRESD